jgi:hypothetical protein
MTQLISEQKIEEAAMKSNLLSQLIPDIKRMLELQAKIHDNATTCVYNSRNAELCDKLRACNDRLYSELSELREKWGVC